MSEIIGFVVGKGCIGKMICGAIGAIGGIEIGSVIGSAGTRAGAGSMVVGGFKALGSLAPLKSMADSYK